MDQYIGKMLNDRYEILERIGTGGMAMVYKAKCHYLNRLVAIKLLRSDLAQDADFRRRFNAESQAVAQLSHPNIVPVYDVSKGGDEEYIVMELIDGITLKQYMEKRGQLSWREALHFMTQIMRGLSHAHSRSIVHRDIKPQNIMVLRDGTVKVTDFGFACLENGGQTMTQEAFGSVHYISPEQARGDRIDARSDIYSAGVVLYEMLTGRLPFEGDNAVSVALQHLSSIPLAPREVNPDVPEALELITMKAMAADIDRRYASAEEMFSDLESFRKNPEGAVALAADDLKEDAVDEPTRPLKTGEMAAAAAAARQAGDKSERRTERKAERRKPEPDDDWDEPERRRSSRQKSGATTGALIGVGVAAALLLVFFLFRGIFDSFGASGNEAYTVPSVLGYTVEQAQELEGVKDVFEIVEVGTAPSEKYLPGQIMEQSPDANSQTKSSLVIKVTVSTGEDNGEMIDVTNQTVQNAEKVLLKDLIQRYELKIEKVDETSEEINEGYVIRTEPAAGSLLKKGDTVKLFISIGPGETVVPNFVGQNIDKAKAQMETWKLTFAGMTEVESPQPAGEILEQSIPDATTVPVNSEITFVVSSGPVTPPVNQVGEVTISPELPTDRDVVELRVDLNGEMVFNQTVECNRPYYDVVLNGTGMGIVTYYWDGVEQNTIEVDFS